MTNLGLKSNFWKNLFFKSVYIRAILAGAILANVASFAYGEANKEMRIAVIGAGASGLTAAHNLKKLGYDNVVVFEKEAQVGGKVLSYMHEGRAYELGAVWFTNDYKTIIGLANEFGIQKMAARDVDYLMPDGTILNQTNYVLKNFKPVEFAWATLNYGVTLTRFPEVKKPGFVGLNADFNLPLEDFSRKYKFLPITQTVAPLMSGCGYGFYKEIPAMYWMKLVPMISNLAAQKVIPFYQGLWSFPDGFQSLWVAVASNLDVRLNTAVTRIERFKGDGENRIRITANGQQMEFDRVIISTPLDKVSSFMSLSEREQRLFSKVHNLRYAVTLAKTNNHDHVGVVENVTPNRINHVNFIAQYYADSDLTIFYQLLDNKITEEDAAKVLANDLGKVGITIDKVLTKKTWSYFPQVTQKDLDEGFYQRIDNLQGVQGTYYIGGVMNFETVEHTAAYSEYLVKRFFTEK